jgi:hypothetical protein
MNQQKRAQSPRLIRVTRLTLLTLCVSVGSAGAAGAAAKPDPKICAQITMIGKLNKSATQARSASGDDSEKNFLTTLNSAVTALIPAHEALGKLVAKADRSGVSYAAKRIKGLQADLKKATAANVLDIYSKWSTADVANFDISAAKLGYLDFVTKNAAACKAYPKVFFI